jgi:outer membrane lipoprotein SlyB
MKSGFYAGILLFPLALGACSITPSSNTYTTAQAGTLQDVKYGTILSVRNVMIREDNAETGKVAGGVIGGTVGSDVGEGKGQIIGSVAGAVIGGTVGIALDRSIQSKPGVEITVRMDDNRTVAIAQLADEPFRVGEQVKVLTSQDGKARITH